MPDAHLDEEAKEVVVLDLERLDLGRLDVAGLECRHDLAGVVAQLPGLVEGEVVTRPHESAVAGEQRQVLGEGRAEHQSEFAVDLTRGGGGVREFGRQVGLLQQPTGKSQRGRETIPESGQVTRAAAAEAQTGEGAGHVGRAFQDRPDFGPPPPVGDREADGVEPGRDAHRIGQGPGEPLGEQPAAGRRHGEIDGVQQRAPPLAAERARHLEVRAGRGIDLDDEAPLRPRRGLQRRARVELGAGDVADRGAGGRELGPRERAESVERLDAVPFAQTPLGRGWVGRFTRDPAHGGGAIIEQGAERRFRRPCRPAPRSRADRAARAARRGRPPTLRRP